MLDPDSVPVVPSADLDEIGAFPICAALSTAAAVAMVKAVRLHRRSR